MVFEIRRLSHKGRTVIARRQSSINEWNNVSILRLRAEPSQFSGPVLAHGSGLKAFPDAPDGLRRKAPPPVAPCR